MVILKKLKLIKLNELSNKIGSLASIQIFNYIFAIITIPYLTRILGSNSYGEVVFMQVILIFLNLIADIGVSWYSTREISINRNNLFAVSKIFWQSWILQWVIFFILSICLLLISSTKIHHISGFNLLLFLLPSVFGYILYPIWLFHGLELMKLSAMIFLISRILSLPFLYLLVSDSRDIEGALIFNSLPYIIAGVFSLYKINKNNYIIFTPINNRELILFYKKTYTYFISKASISLYNIVIPFALGFFGGNEQLAYFNLAEKVKLMVLSIYTPITQALTPKMVYFVHNDYSKFISFAKKTILIQTIILFPIGIILNIFSEEIITLLAGDKFIIASDTLKILSFTPWIISVSNVLGHLMMLSLGFTKQYNVTNFSALVLSFLLIYIFKNDLTSVLTSYIVLLVEILFMIVFLLITIKYKMFSLKINK